MTTKAMKKGDSSTEAMRKCIATGELYPKSELLRFVIGPDGLVVHDVLEKLPGRGIWVLADKGALEKAVSKKLFSRAAKTQVHAPDDLVDRVEAALAKRVISLVAMARKAGRAVTGATKVKDRVAGPGVAALFQARDGSPREKSRIRLHDEGETFECLTKSELGEAFGREFAVHAALDTGGLAARVIEEAIRLKGFRPEASTGRMKG